MSAERGGSLFGGGEDKCPVGEQMSIYARAWRGRSAVYTVGSMVPAQ